MGKSKNKKNVNVNDMEMGIFKTGFPMLDLLTGRDHIPDISKPGRYYKIRGFRSSTMMGIFSESTLGKTTLCLNIGGNIIRRYPYENIQDTIPSLHYYGAEGGADLARICSTTGIPYGPEAKEYIEIYQRKEATTDQMFKEFKEICEEKEKNPDKYKGEVRLGNNKSAYRYLPTIFLIDSISVLAPEQLDDKDKVDNMHAATRARINGNYLMKMRKLASKFNIMIFVIQHETSSIDTNMFASRKRRGYSRNVDATGGKKAEFEQDVQLRIDKVVAHNRKKTQKKYTNDEDFSSIVRAVVTKNRFGEANSDMNFYLVQHRLYGFDPLHSYVYDILEKTDIIEHSGGRWFKLRGRDKKFGKADIVDLIKKDSKFRTKIREGMNNEYHEFLKYHDTDDILNKQQELLDDML